MKSLPKKIMGILLVLLLVVSLTGCGSPAAQPPSPDKAGAAASKLKVALLLPGPISDNGWNASAYQGLKEAEAQFGVEGSYVENVAQSDQLAKFRAYAQQGYNVVIGHGFEFGEAAKQVAKEFPQVKFIVTSSDITQPPNLGSLNVVSQQAGFLGGVVAALLSKSGKVAEVGGMEIPPIQTFLTGFKQGVKYTNQLTGKNVQALGALTGSFDDVAKNKEMAKTFINQGADVILGDADQASAGIIQAAQQAKVLAIGVGGNQTNLAPDTVVVSTIRSMPVAIEFLIKTIMDGKWEPKYYPVGINENACRLEWNDQLKNKLSEQDLKLVDQVVSDYKAGKIDLNTLPQ
ncbi:BMP family protein [Paradesulfitobacterium ferrireducens]|uniref:BMP family protein n=1 Tax=Paradesulfitobacterium ferrireducens TaxID=2816476 RepID=UPI001A8D4E3B|nr:BMP family protein [Paradesulfitobacterium ferrireducens]